MPKTVWADRSRIETYQRCPRLRWLEYHQDGRGIAPLKKPLPLCVGGSVHKGLETLLRACMGPVTYTNLLQPNVIEEDAVAAALADFSTHRGALALDTAESVSMAAVPVDSFDAQLSAQAKELGMDASDPAMAELFGRQRNAAAEFDGWLWREQAALVEGMVRAYARRRLRPLLDEYEVLEVEREGDWELYEGIHGTNLTVVPAIRFMSRPDALLRSRADNSLYLLSYKTASAWDVRKARDAEHDMQGLSEGVEVERRLGEWWLALSRSDKHDPALAVIPIAMQNYLHALPAPPRILGIRYEYLLKGSRWADKELSSRFGLSVWSQRSHLIRRFVAHSTPSRGKNASAFSVGDSAWSWDYHLEDGSASKLSASNWHGEPVWEHEGGVKAWIDLLDASQEALSAYDSTTGAEPRPLGWKSGAQAIGYTAQHPLDVVFVPPIAVYRNDDDLRDWVEETESQERGVAEHVAAVEGATDEGELRHLLNLYFRRTRKACEYPSTCAMSRVCWGGDDIRSAPLQSGLYKVRELNHPQEGSQGEGSEAADV